MKFCSKIWLVIKVILKSNISSLSPLVTPHTCKNVISGKTTLVYRQKCIRTSARPISLFSNRYRYLKKNIADNRYFGYHALHIKMTPMTGKTTFLSLLILRMICMSVAKIVPTVEKMVNFPVTKTLSSLGFFHHYL